MLFTHILGVTTYKENCFFYIISNFFRYWEGEEDDSVRGCRECFEYALFFTIGFIRLDLHNRLAL